MKKIKMLLATAVAALFVLSIPRTVNAGNAQPHPQPYKPAAAYVVELEESNNGVPGAYEWVWSIQNPNPGNGNNGTTQALSHFNFSFEGVSCFKFAEDVVSAAYSFDGVNWSEFTPGYAKDNSQACVATPVLKYNVGTKGAAKTYFKLVVTKAYPVATATGYYKSGSKTGCGMLSFEGIGCVAANVEEPWVDNN